MKKKLLLAACAVTCATALTVGFTACGGGDDNKGMSASDAATKIATFTTSPNTVNATFKQKYKLDVNSENASFKSFAKDIDDTVTIQADYTAGNLYYYGKKVAKDNSVVEQLVVKEDSKYYCLTTTTAKQELVDEAAAKTKINELMTSLSKQTAGYVDGNAFTYSANWVNTYLLLGSNTVKGNESSYFTYKYDTAEGDGLKVDIDMKYVGYYGDAGTFEFGTDDTHTGASAAIVTNDKGYITSFNQNLSNHLDMRITSTPIPLDLAGTRSLTATYNETLTKKVATDIEQNIPTTSNITVPTVAHATIATYDFNKDDFSTLAKTSTTVTEGNYVAVKVTCDEGYELVSVKVNGNDTQEMNGYYCLMTPAEAGTTYTVTVVVGKEGEEAPTTGTITVENVEHATVATYNFKEGDLTTLNTPSTTIDVGNFVAVKVNCDEGYEVVSVTVNGTAANLMFGYYCKKIESAGDYKVVVLVKPASGEEEATTGTIVCNSPEHCTVVTADFNLASFQFKNGTTVELGNKHYVAVKVTCEEGNSVKSVVVNGTDVTSTAFGYVGWYCYETTTDVTTYAVVISLN